VSETVRQDNKLHCITGLLHRIKNTRGPIYKISYDFSQDYRKFIVRSTYDSDLRAKSSLGNVVSSFTNTISDDLTMNCIREKPYDTIRYEMLF